MIENDAVLLRAILSVTARQTFSANNLAEIVGAGEKQHRAFNLCDGTRTQGEIAKAAKIDKASFSRSVARWTDSGILFRLGEGRETKLLHVYPLPANAAKQTRSQK
jgi:hypothetical protein